MSDHEITTVQFNRPCPVCEGFMELSSIELGAVVAPNNGRAPAVLLQELRHDAVRMERDLGRRAEHCARLISGC